jgi:hypothetical protein
MKGRAFPAAKSRNLDATFVVDAFLLANAVAGVLLQIKGETFFASPLFAVLAESAAWTFTLLAVIAPTPQFSTPRRPLVQVLLKFRGR